MTIESRRTYRVIEVPQGSTGAFLVLTLKSAGVGVNVSAATTIRYCAKTFTGTAVATDVAGAKYTDGTDGKIKVQLTSALVDTVRDLLAHFEALPINGGTLVSETVILRVQPNARGV
jgi:hypothetical protein